MHSFRYGFRCLILLAAVASGRLAAAELPWKHDLNKGIEEARKDGKRVFIDFTGEDCVNCKLNEKNVFPLPEVQERLRKFVLVQLYTDRLPNRFYPPEIQKKFGEDTEQQEKDAEPNRKLMAKFEIKANPVYVVVEPAGASYKEVTRYTGGRIEVPKDFLDFLDAGLERAARPSRPVVSQGKPPATANLIDFDVKVQPSKAQSGPSGEAHHHRQAAEGVSHLSSHRAPRNRKCPNSADSTTRAPRISGRCGPSRKVSRRSSREKPRKAPRFYWSTRNRSPGCKTFWSTLMPPPAPPNCPCR